MAKTTSTPAPTQEEVAKDNRMSAARSAATTTLRENHLDEYNALLVAEAEARGLTWAPRKTPAQKRAEEFQRLLAEDPSLAALVTDSVPTVTTAEV